MVDPMFCEASAPVEAMRVPQPTIADVDNHPDRAFIWAVILQTRRACKSGEPRLVRPYLD